MSNKTFNNTNPSSNLVNQLLSGTTTIQNETVTGNETLGGNLTVSGNINATGSTNIIGNSNSLNTLNGSTTLGVVTLTSLNTIPSTTIAYIDPTSSIQTQLNSKQANIISTTDFTAHNVTVNQLNGISSARINYLSTVTSNVQTQLSSLQPTIISSTDITAHNVTVNQLNGISSSTLAYIDPTSSIQTQLNGKQNALSASVAVTAGSLTCSSENDTGNLTVGGVATFNGGVTIGTGQTLNGITNTTLSYLDPTSSIQTQINSKQASIISSTDLTAHNVTVNQLNGIPSTTIAYLDPTSSIQTQLNAKTSLTAVQGNANTFTGTSNTFNNGVSIGGSLTCTGAGNNIGTSGGTTNIIGTCNTDVLTCSTINTIPSSYLTNISSNVQSQISNVILKPDRWFYGVSTYKNIDPTYSTVSYVYPDLSQRPTVYINWVGDSTPTNSMMSSALLEVNYELIGGYTHSTTVLSSGIQPISYTSGSPPTNLLNAWWNYIEVYQEPAGLTTNSSAWMTAGWGSQSNSKASLLGSCNYMQYKQSGPASPYIAPTAVAFIPITPIYISNKKMSLTFAFPNVLPVQVATVVTLPGYVTGVRISVKIVNSNSCLTGSNNGYFGMSNSEITGGGFSPSGGAYLSSS